MSPVPLGSAPPPSSPNRNRAHRATIAGLCDGTFSIGGSMIIGDDFVLSLSSKVTAVKITGGTGRYRHAHGTVVAKTVGPNTDFTIKLH